MSIISAIVSAIFGGGGSGPNFAHFNPDDIEHFQRASYEITEADEDEAKLKAAYAKYGIKNEDHWGQISCAFYERYKADPDFHVAGTKLRVEEQIEEMRQSYEMPARYLADVEGIGLDRLAAITARREAASGPAQVQEALSRYGLDEPSFQRINSEWSSRMGGSADAMAAGILNGFWHTYITVARSAVQKAA